MVAFEAAASQTKAAAILGKRNLGFEPIRGVNASASLDIEI